jgi:hypothetical protein
MTLRGGQPPPPALTLELLHTWETFKRENAETPVEELMQTFLQACEVRQWALDKGVKKAAADERRRELSQGVSVSVHNRTVVDYSAVMQATRAFDPTPSDEEHARKLKQLVAKLKWEGKRGL